MKSVLSLALLAALAACGRSVDMFPVGVGTGGGGGTGSGTVDAPGDGIAGSTINGRVCLINDARRPTTCATTGADGVLVLLGTTSVTTAADGSFSIVPTSNTDLVWHATGTAIQASAMELRFGKTIPAISKGIFDTMVATNQAVPSNGTTGSVIARFTLAATPIAGIQVITTPAAQSPIYYDNSASATQWTNTQTGSYGVAWVAGLFPGSVELSLSGAQNATLSGIPVFTDTVTYVLAEIQ